MGKISKAVIPAAGLGTRFLPATKAMPKEMLPIVDKPAIQYVVEEAVHSGLTHILMVTGRNKNALENHFDRAVELESLLSEKGDLDKLSIVEFATDIADIHYVRQGDPLGLGHAVLKAQTFVGNEPFALLLGDDLIGEDENLLTIMIRTAEKYNANVIGLIEVPENEVSKYGIVSLGAELEDNTYTLLDLVEKPQPKNAPSNLGIIGRYVLQPGIFEVIGGLRPGVNQEIQLTDALQIMAKNQNLAGPVIGLVFSGDRYDTGDKFSYLKAVVELGSKREDIGTEFLNWLSEFNK